MEVAMVLITPLGLIAMELTGHDESLSWRCPQGLRKGFIFSQNRKGAQPHWLLTSTKALSYHVKFWEASSSDPLLYLLSQSLCLSKPLSLFLSINHSLCMGSSTIYSLSIAAPSNYLWKRFITYDVSSTICMYTTALLNFHDIFCKTWTIFFLYLHTYEVPLFWGCITLVYQFYKLIVTLWWFIVTYWDGIVALKIGCVGGNSSPDWSVEWVTVAVAKLA